MIRDLTRMTSPEAAEAMTASRDVVLPVGSIEQHGPHLPNGTDTMAAELVARGRRGPAGRGLRARWSPTA